MTFQSVQRQQAASYEQSGCSDCSEGGQEAGHPKAPPPRAARVKEPQSDTPEQDTRLHGFSNLWVLSVFPPCVALSGQMAHVQWSCIHGCVDRHPAHEEDRIVDVQLGSLCKSTVMNPDVRDSWWAWSEGIQWRVASRSMLFICIQPLWLQKTDCRFILPWHPFMLFCFLTVMAHFIQ